VEAGGEGGDAAVGEGAEKGAAKSDEEVVGDKKGLIISILTLLVSIPALIGA